MNTYNDFGSTIMDFFGIGSAGRERAFNAEQAQIARDFAKDMSNTTYQRTVADMEKAGINPALAAMGGQTAPMPGSISASTTANKGINMADIVNGAANMMQALHNGTSPNSARNARKETIKTIATLSKMLK